MAKRPVAGAIDTVINSEATIAPMSDLDRMLTPLLSSLNDVSAGGIFRGHVQMMPLARMFGNRT
jgi:hypothetical protein